jgi:hypothetical protein
LADLGVLQFGGLRTGLVVVLVGFGRALGQLMTKSASAFRDVYFGHVRTFRKGDRERYDSKAELRLTQKDELQKLNCNIRAGWR